MRNSTFRSRGIGGINTWRDAVEFMLLGAGNVQVCTAVMHYGYRIVEDMIDGLNNYLDEKGFASVNDIVGQSVEPRHRLGKSRPQLRRQGRASTKRNAFAAISATSPAKTALTRASICQEVERQTISATSSKKNASAATSATSSAPHPERSRWNASTPAANRSHGESVPREDSLSSWETDYHALLRSFF